MVLASAFSMPKTREDAMVGGCVALEYDGRAEGLCTVFPPIPSVSIL